MAEAPREAILKAFARRLEHRMAERGWIGPDLARHASRHLPNGRKLGRDDVSGYLKGKHLPGPIDLRALADALKCQPSDLIPLRDLDAAHGMPVSESGVLDGGAVQPQVMAAPFMTSSEFAKACGVCYRSIERWVAQGKLEPASYTLGGHARFTEDQVEEVKARGRSRRPQGDPPKTLPVDTLPTFVSHEDRMWIRERLAKRRRMAELREMRKGSAG